MKRALIATGAIATVGALATAVTTASCDTVCTLEARPSVILRVFEEGETVPANVAAQDVWYTVTDDSGRTETLRGECLDDECTEWILGYEQPGDYEIHASVCGHEYTAAADVDMEDDGCHVATAWVDLQVDTSDCPSINPGTNPTLGSPPPTECTLEARPSVVVDVLAEQNGRLVPIRPERVFYLWEDDPAARQWPGYCMKPDCSKFIAGWEQTGTFRVAAEVCGRVITESVDVAETADGCHVDTRHVALVATELACAAPPFVAAPEIPTCDRRANPSAYVFVVEDGTDVWLPHYVEDLTVWHGSTRSKGWCVDGRTDGSCSTFIAGWEQEGRFRVQTETCGEVIGTAFAVPMADDGCHVLTQYVPLFVNTTGCVSARPPGPGIPPPPPLPR